MTIRPHHRLSPGAAPMTPTQEDSEAVERLPLTQGSAKQVLLHAFMRHRLAAEERGARMALEAAAKVAESLHCPEQADYYALIAKAVEALGMRLATAIRQIDPASLGLRIAGRWGK